MNNYVYSIEPRFLMNHFYKILYRMQSLVFVLFTAIISCLWMITMAVKQHESELEDNNYLLDSITEATGDY